MSDKFKFKIFKFLLTSFLLGTWVRFKPNFPKSYGPSSKPKRKITKHKNVWFNPRAKTTGNKFTLLQVNLGKNDLDK